MDISAVDRSATQGDSWLHRATPRAKLLVFACVLAVVMMSWDITFLVAIAVVLFAALVSARANLRLGAGLAAYPAIFAALFAVASAPSAAFAVVVVLKAAAAGLAAVTLALTTPYPQVFAPLQAVVPGVVGDALLMTYRTFFLLLARFSEMMIAVRLRSASRSGGIRRALKDTASALGNVVLYSFDLAQRDYDVLYVRGYTGRLRAAQTRRTPGVGDAFLVAIALSLLGAGVTWRVAPERLGAYTWLAMIPALAALAASLIRRRTA